ncbi:MAG: A/G-specific adenine glycosylase [Chitinophagia bacterium]|nr:A/G-specific adenine glycosylase [Chitinophagia bacterium]
MLSNQLKKQFTSKLLDWHAHENFRTLPWKEEQDPYKIWLSEIILQQTRAEQGLPYYLRFINQYPTVIDLAEANDDHIFKLWEGLGYYNRCRNLLFTARVIKDQYQGVFPKNYNEILNLKGIGSYTAAAIASFAYNLPYAVVDGNVYRVLARYAGIELPIDSNEGKKTIASLAQELIARDQAAAYNQAIMDFGASICKPKNPLCETPTHYWIEKRTDSDIWRDLHQPFLVESDKKLSAKQLQKQITEQALFVSQKQPKLLIQKEQKLSHQLIISTIYSVNIDNINECNLKNGIWVQKMNLHNFAMPKTLIEIFN